MPVFDNVSFKLAAFAPLVIANALPGPVAPKSPAVMFAITFCAVIFALDAVLAVLADNKSNVVPTVPLLNVTPVALVFLMKAEPPEFTVIVVASVLNLVVPSTPMSPPVASSVSRLLPVFRVPTIEPAVEVRLAPLVATEPTTPISMLAAFAVKLATANGLGVNAPLVVMSTDWFAPFPTNPRVLLVLSTTIEAAPVLELYKVAIAVVAVAVPSTV